MADHLGEQFGNYRLIRLLDQGGFAEVYLGEHIHLKTQAAVKLLHLQITEGELQNFTREAQIVARLKHPHIIHILDFGIERAIPFLVMDYAPQGSLRHAHPKRCRVPLPTCVRYIQQVADALQYAHDHKIIHRDIKPENMLVTDTNDILLSDFGIAIISQSSRYQGTQEIGGTVAYMAPEQLQGKAVAASDQYALGIVLYEWLSGAVPFVGSFAEICSQHLLVQPPSLLVDVPDLPQEVDLVIQKALAKDPQLRYPQIREFAAALEQASKVNTSSTSLSHRLTQPNASQLPIILTPTKESHPQATQPIPLVPLLPPRRQRNVLVLLLTIALCLALLISASGWIWGLMRLPRGLAPSAGGNQTKVSTSYATNTPQSALSPTVTTSISTSTPTPGPSAPTLASSETLQENIRLACQPGCVNPLQVTINSVHVDVDKYNTTINFTLDDTGGTNVDITFKDFSLQSTYDTNQISGTIPGIPLLYPDTPQSSKVIYSFVPYHNVKYNLTVSYQDSAASTEPPVLQFNTVQITF